MYNKLFNKLILKKVVPLIWVAMSNRTKVTYKAVFEIIKEKFPNLKPEKAHTDFEDAMRNAFQDTYPECDIIGCHFHYAQVVDFIIDK